VTTKGEIVTAEQLHRTNSPDIKVLVPKGMIVSYEYSSQYGNKVIFSNMSNEIEVSANYNSVVLDNVTGPLTVKSVYGHVEAVFDNQIKGPISIISIYGYVDVSLPVTIKADLKLDTSYGEIFAAPEFKIEFEDTSGSRKGERVVGKINGGGIKMDFTCNYGKVYLRKK
jgi:predicted membrane protein